MLILDLFQKNISYLKKNKDNIKVFEYDGNDGEKLWISKIKVMGDLQYKNILFDGTKFYYIDFELSDEKFILHDIFTLMFFAYYDGGDNMLISNYFKGLYDAFIDEMFELSGITYFKNKKIEYFKIFIQERLDMENSNTSKDIKHFFEKTITKMLIM